MLEESALSLQLNMRLPKIIYSFLQHKKIRAMKIRKQKIYINRDISECEIVDPIAKWHIPYFD